MKAIRRPHVASIVGVDGMKEEDFFCLFCF